MQRPSPSADSACPDEERLAAFAEGALDHDQAAALEKHIDACPGCYHVLAIYARAYSTTRGGREKERSSAVAGSPASVSDVPSAGHGPPGSVSDGTRVARLQRSMALAPGMLVGRYVVLEWIGEGSAGIVYAAYDPKLDRKIAVKLIRPERSIAQDESGKAALLREARAMAKLTHPNVVNVHDAGVFDDCVFIAMEFVEGSTLRAWLREPSRTKEDSLGVFLEAGRGLAAAHTAGLVHRDFKPDNVLIGKDGRARVADFGLARLRSAGDVAPTALDAKASSAAGTPAYMSPEQKRGCVVDARSDQYSFCVALYEALEGRRPFEDGADDARGVRRAPQVTPRVRKILARGLREAPEERYPTMQQLLADLGESAASHSRRLAVLGAALLTVASIAVGYRVGGARSQSAVCSGAEGKLLDVWAPSRKAAVRGAFLATNKPYALDAWRGVERAFDTYARDWIATRTDTCEATRVRGEQSAEVLDLRMACLADRLEDMNALAGVFEHADAETVAKAVGAAQALPRLGQCDAKVVRSRGAPPRDPATQAEVDRVRPQLTHANALWLAGRYKDLLPIAAEVAAAARATGYAPLEGEALFRYGNTLGQTGDLAGARAVLYDAARAADEAGDDRTRVLALARLVYFVGDRQANYEEARLLRAAAESALVRMGGDDDLRAEVLEDAAAVALSEGKYEQARDMHEQALHLRERLYGPEGDKLPLNLSNLGLAYVMLGNYERARELYQRALSIGEKTLGAAHPSIGKAHNNLGQVFGEQLEFTLAEEQFRRAVAIEESAVGMESYALAIYLDNLGQALVEQGKAREGVECHARSLSIRERTLPADHPTLLLSLAGLGRGHIALGEPARAIPLLERALPLQSKPTTPVADAQFLLAEALVQAGRDLPRAHSLAVSAREIYEKSSRSALDRRARERVREWLAAHPVARRTG